MTLNWGKTKKFIGENKGNKQNLKLQNGILLFEISQNTYYFNSSLPWHIEAPQLSSVLHSSIAATFLKPREEMHNRGDNWSPHPTHAPTPPAQFVPPIERQKNHYQCN